MLIVEDEPLVLEVARDEFTDAGFRVLTAVDGDAALAVLTGPARIDLLFTDIRMPGALDGWAVARRARELRPAMRVIYATGFSAEVLPMVPGALFFRKPYRVTQVLESARQLGVG